MIRLVQTSMLLNISGFTDRLERGYSVKHETVNYQHVRAPVMVQKPQIEDLNSLIVVHDMIEQYV